MGSPSLIALAALYAFVPMGLAFFFLAPVRHALAAVYVLGWVFLPPAININIPGLPDLGKYFVIALTSFLGAVMFDFKTVSTFRPAWYDVPMLVLIVSPFLTSVANGLGPWDGLSWSFSQVTWTLPYVLGRIYYSDLTGIRTLMLWILAGVIISMPLGWIEMRLSPQLNKWVYGYYQHQFAQTRRYGGFRPMVFMHHGLMFSLWMAAGALIAFYLWMSGAVRKLAGVPIQVWTILLGLSTVMCRSFGALALLIIGVGAGLLIRKTRTPVLLIGLMMLPLVYVTVRATDLWDGSQLTRISETIGGNERAGSLNFRLEQEVALVNHAWKQPVLGWGRWNRNRPSVAEAGFVIVADGYWVIIFGQMGFVGLAAMLCIYTLPVVLFVYRWRGLGATHPMLAPGLAAAMIMFMFMVDNLFNAMLNPVYMIATGALMSLAPTAAALTQLRGGAAAPAQGGWILIPVAPGQTTVTLPPGMVTSSSTSAHRP